MTKSVKITIATTVIAIFGVLVYILYIHQDKPNLDKASTPAIIKFEYIKPPMTMTSQEDAVSYLLDNFWDKFNFTDTLFVTQKTELELAVSNYIYYLSLGDSVDVSKSLSSLIEESHQNQEMHYAIIDNLTKYISDPNSPMRNELVNVSMLEALIASNKTDSIEKAAHIYTLNNVRKNMVGSRATDFDYTTKNGDKGSMHALKSKYTLLLFYNIGCHTCSESIAELYNNSNIKRLVASKDLTVLSINSDKTSWEEGKIPAEWIDCRDDNSCIDDKKLYDIPAIPSIYLLDEKKNVILKDSYSLDVIHFFTPNLK